MPAYFRRRWREALLNPGEVGGGGEERKAGFPHQVARCFPGLSAAGFTGLADPLYNAALGVKYQRDLTGVLACSTNSFFAGALQKLVEPMGQQSKHQLKKGAAAKGAYELAIQPLMALSVGFPTVSLIGYGLGASYAYLSSPTAKQRFQDGAWSGRQQEGQDRRGWRQAKGVLKCSAAHRLLPSTCRPLRWWGWRSTRATATGRTTRRRIERSAGISTIGFGTTAGRQAWRHHHGGAGADSAAVRRREQFQRQLKDCIGEVPLYQHQRDAYGPGCPATPAWVRPVARRWCAS